MPFTLAVNYNEQSNASQEVNNTYKIKINKFKNNALMFYNLTRLLNRMGILFYLIFVGAGLSAAFLIQKALKAIKLI